MKPSRPGTNVTVAGTEEGSQSAKVPTVVLVTVLWVALTAFHGFGVFLFAGWLGVADDFIPWSGAAFLLWWFTRRKLDLKPMRRTVLGRLIGGLWIVAVGLALWGIDHRPTPLPIEVIGVVYLVLPVLPVFIVVVASVRALRSPGRLEVESHR